MPLFKGLLLSCMCKFKQVVIMNILTCQVFSREWECVCEWIAECINKSDKLSKGIGGIIV